jgi:hypothetical protein
MGRNRGSKPRVAGADNFSGGDNLRRMVSAGEFQIVVVHLAPLLLLPRRKVKLRNLPF